MVLSRWLTLFCSLAISALGALPEAPDALTVNDVTDPVGTPAEIRFGWMMRSPNPDELQSGYRIQVASSLANLEQEKGDFWDSGVVPSRSQSHVAYGGRPLLADHVYFWHVRTLDGSGNAGPYSREASFVVGLERFEDWAPAQWIRRPARDADDYTYYRKTFTLPDKQVERATAYVSGSHRYEVWSNGKWVGRGQAHQYPQHQYYNAFPLEVHPGGNVFALFNHWFGGGQGRAPTERGILVKIVVHFADGTETQFVSDETWVQSRAEAWVPGQASRNPGEGVGFVERIDGRKWALNWNQVDFDASRWEAVEVVGPARTDPWTRAPRPELTRLVEEVVKPVAVTKVGESYVVDFGRVYAGTPRVAFSGGKVGQLVRMQGGYALDAQGRIDPAQNQRTDLTYLAELTGGRWLYSPAEYMGLRYLQLDSPPMPVTPDAVSLLVRHTALDREASAFESSDETLNRVWALMKHSVTVCAQEEFVDTPTREKGGFLMDGALMSAVAMPTFHERALTQRQLGEFFLSMEQFWNAPETKGRVNAVYPNNDGGRDIPDFTQAFVLWAWDYYWETGDLGFLRAHYERLKSIGDYVLRARDEKTGLITDLPGGAGPYRFGIIDWPASMRFGYDMTTRARAVINAWAYADFTLLARMARELGNEADARRFAAEADRLKVAYVSRLFNADGLCCDGLLENGAQSPHSSQHANAFSLAFGLVPETQQARVMEKVKADGMRMGMVTVRQLIRALGEANEGEALLRLYTDREQMGWARTLARGGTCTWETWTADVDGESQSHGWGAIGLEGMIRYILGIRPVKAGYEEVEIRPLDFGNRLGFARGRISTDRGQIEVSWERRGDRCRMEVSLPPNMRAHVFIPGGAAAGEWVGAGQHDFGTE